MDHQDNLTEDAHANIALYKQRTLWNEAITQDYLIPSQVAELYHVNVSTIYRWIHEGWLEVDKIDGKNGSKGVRYHISPLSLEEMDRQQDRLIEESKRYWMRLYVKMGMKTRK